MARRWLVSERCSLRRRPWSTSPGFSSGTKAAGVALVSCFALVACSLPGFRQCSPDQAVPAAFIDTGLFAIDDPDRTLVCLDVDCSPLGQGAGRDGTVTEVPVIGDRIQRSIVIRTVDGVVLAGPTVVELPVLEVGCPGEALQGHYVVSETGEIDEVP